MSPPFPFLLSLGLKTVRFMFVFLRPSEITCSCHSPPDVALLGVTAKVMLGCFKFFMLAEVSFPESRDVWQLTVTVTSKC